VFFSFAQSQSKQQVIEVIKELYKLRDYSLDFDQIKRSNNLSVTRKDSIEKLYRNQIEKIKYGPQRDQFLKFLNYAIEENPSNYQMFGFNYTHDNELRSVRRNQLPTLLEYLRAVRYSLFEMNKEELLPMGDTPFLRYKKDIKPRIDNIDQATSDRYNNYFKNKK